MKRYCLILDETDISLIRGLLNQHLNIAIRKRNVYEYSNFDGCSNRICSEYKKLVSRFRRLLNVIKVER